MKIIAVMPIKLNNERLPGKNEMLLGGKFLLRYMLDTLSECDRIEKTYVYCSSDKVREYMNNESVFLRRPTSLDLPTSNFTQIFSSFSDTINADVYVFAHATAPYIETATVNAMIDAVVDGGFDSAFTATKIQDFLWQDGKPLNFDPANLPRTQDLRPIYRETSGVYVFRKEVFSGLHRRIGKKPYIVEVSPREAVDINTLQDFRFAELLLKRDI